MSENDIMDPIPGKRLEPNKILLPDIRIGKDHFLIDRETLVYITDILRAYMVISHHGDNDEIRYFIKKLEGMFK